MQLVRANLFHQPGVLYPGGLGFKVNLACVAPERRIGDVDSAKLRRPLGYVEQESACQLIHISGSRLDAVDGDSNAPA